LTRIIRIHELGGPEVLRYEDVELPQPGPKEVSIAVRAIGLNRSESMFRTGNHIERPRFPARLGFEAAGIVSAMGSEVSGLAVGDRVAVVPPPSVSKWGTYGEIATVPGHYVTKIPDNVSWTEAAATWMANITAYGGLIDLAGLHRDDHVLILAASSSVGLAAIQVAKAIGATAIAVTRTDAKKEALLNAGADHVVASTTEDLAGRVREITGDKGVRVAFDPVAGPGLEKVCEAMARYGIIVAYGHLDPAPSPLPLFALIGKGLTIRGFTFREIAIDPARLEAAKAFIVDGLAGGTLRPVIDRVFDFEDMVEAHRYLESNVQFGKIVATV
jgi:NADPH:quinone reductase-like Zn-dependent oxidoreductase